MVLKYVRPVIKRRDTQVLSCPPAPVGVIDGSRADVSFIAGMMIDKFVYHQPLHRQHLRLRDCSIAVSRAWLTQLTQKAVALIEPVFDAQLESVRMSRVKAMDETPIKAGQAGPGKLKAAYFWPVYGEQDEICFLFYPSRSARHVQEALGLDPPPGAAKRELRMNEAKPWVDKFFGWVDKQFEVQGLLPSNPLLGALASSVRPWGARPIRPRANKPLPTSSSSPANSPRSPISPPRAPRT